jgi:hypothetical protein
MTESCSSTAVVILGVVVPVDHLKLVIFYENVCDLLFMRMIVKDILNDASCDGRTSFCAKRIRYSDRNAIGSEFTKLCNVNRCPYRALDVEINRYSLLVSHVDSGLRRTGASGDLESVAEQGCLMFFSEDGLNSKADLRLRRHCGWLS